MLKWPDVLQRAATPLVSHHRVNKSDAHWRAVLTPEQYRVTRQHGTERPFSSELCSLFTAGQYHCVCCDTWLFDANEKFESGTGWPSFTQAVQDWVLSYLVDQSHGMTRVEVLCSTCDAHLGHVFPDGPAPSGLRYCMNAVALKKQEETGLNSLANVD